MTTIHFSNTYHKPSKFDNYQHNSDGTMTTIITTCLCEICGYQSIHLEQTPVTLMHGQHLMSHDPICNTCEWENNL